MNGKLKRVVDIVNILPRTTATHTHRSHYTTLSCSIRTCCITKLKSLLQFRQPRLKEFARAPRSIDPIDWCGATLLSSCKLESKTSSFLHGGGDAWQAIFVPLRTSFHSKLLKMDPCRQVHEKNERNLLENVRVCLENILLDQFSYDSNF